MKNRWEGGVTFFLGARATSHEHLDIFHLTNLQLLKMKVSPAPFLRHLVIYLDIGPLKYLSVLSLACYSVLGGRIYGLWHLWAQTLNFLGSIIHGIFSFERRRLNSISSMTLSSTEVGINSKYYSSS